MIYFIVLILFLTLVPLLLLITKKAAKPYPPEPPGAWPVIGHLPLLGSPVHLAHTLGHLAEKHGPIFGLRLGMQPVVVVSSREAVMECFTTNDKSFARRPRSSAGLHLVYDHASFGFTNGPYWRETRKLVMAEVLSPRRLETMRDLRVNEIEMSIQELYVQATGERPKAVVLSRWIDQVALNIIVRTIAGKRIYAEGEVEKFRNLFRELTFLSGEFVLSDVIPIRIIKWIDDRGNVVKRMKYVARELDVIIEGWIKEHVERREKVGKPSEGKDFIDELLSVIDDRFDKYGVQRITIIKATVVNVVLGGFDTTSVYVTWLLALLVNHKSVMKLAQEEIDTKVGKQRWVQESDIKNLPYLEAIIKESLRLYPPLPLSIPHEAEEDCQLGGYHIQKGTLLFVNLLKLHRDPRFWEEPDKFMPERFLTKHAHVDVIGQQFEFTPFGAGRRSCPGTTFAMQVTNLMVARLVQGFNFESPGDGPIDMAEGVGITMPKANPLEVMITPRLHPQLYTNNC